MDLAALDLASIHFPDLRAPAFLDRLNELRLILGDRLRNFNDGRDFVEKASSYLFGELGFHGNETDFFDPLNSCLNQVIEHRAGTTITLAGLYMEISRRLHMPVFGIGLPNTGMCKRHTRSYYNTARVIAYAGAALDHLIQATVQRIRKNLSRCHGTPARRTVAAGFNEIASVVEVAEPELREAAKIH